MVSILEIDPSLAIIWRPLFRGASLPALPTGVELLGFADSNLQQNKVQRLDLGYSPALHHSKWRDSVVLGFTREIILGSRFPIQGLF